MTCVCCTELYVYLQMEFMEADGGFTWQRLGDEGGICVVGKWADPITQRVEETPADGAQ